MSAWTKGSRKVVRTPGMHEHTRPSLSAAIMDSLRSLQARTLGDPAVCVAVLDGPVDVDHPCFRGASLTGVGALATGEAGQGQMSAHGTHVASVIFGQPESPVAGIAPRCRGLLVPVFRDDDQGYLSQLDLARAIEQAVQAGANLINVSGGELAPTGEPDPTLARALQLCDAAGVLVIAATGNDGCDCLHVPASVPTALAVGALTEDGQPLQSGKWGDGYRANGLLAPGERILGAVPGGGTATATGSSFATPIVTGVAALLLDLSAEPAGSSTRRPSGMH
jgi:subtilisin family serine protease